MTDDPDHLLQRLADLPAARSLQARLAGTEIDVWLVGGAVRDLALGRTPRELDLLVETEVSRVAETLGADATPFERFGTAAATVDGFIFDLAQARRETYRDPGALPVVTPATVLEDLARRDFTVNAIALGAFGRVRGRLEAVAHALADLQAGCLRVLHDASFGDDPTRLLRLARYAARLDFAVEPHTLRLARAALQAGALATVSGHRIGTELRLAASEPDPVRTFGALHELGIDSALHAGFGLAGPEPTRGALALLADDGSPARLVLAAALLGMPSAERLALLHAHDFSAPDRDAILAAAQRGPELAGELAVLRRASQVVATVGVAPPEAVALAGAMGGEAAAQHARRWRDAWRHVTLEVDGSDLLAAGVPPGPAVGLGLRAALAAKLDGRARDRASELTEALRAALA